jgi:hypothetical protein
MSRYQLICTRAYQDLDWCIKNALQLCGIVLTFISRMQFW